MYEEEKYANINERDKHVSHTQSIDKNERKAKNVSLKICEIKSFLFSKQNIHDFSNKRVCFLICELQPNFPSLSFEFLQDVKALSLKQR